VGGWRGAPIRYQEIECNAVFENLVKKWSRGKRETEEVDWALVNLDRSPFDCEIEAVWSVGLRPVG